MSSLDENDVAAGEEEVHQDDPDELEEGETKKKRDAASTRIGCNDLYHKDDGSIGSISIEFLKLQQRDNLSQSSLSSGSTLPSTDFESDFNNIAPEVSDVFDSDTADSIGILEAERLDGAQKGASFYAAIVSLAKVEGGIMHRFPDSPEAASIACMKSALIEYRGEHYIIL